MEVPCNYRYEKLTWYINLTVEFLYGSIPVQNNI